MFGWKHNPIEPPAPADPRLDSLLDEALAPEAAPQGLDRAIWMQTRAMLVQRQSGVLARLNQYSWPRALAASVVVAATVSLSYLSISVIHDARINVQTMALIRQDLSTLPAYQLPVTSAAPALAEVRTESSQFRTDLDEIQNSLSQAFPDPESFEDDATPPAVF